MNRPATPDDLIPVKEGFRRDGVDPDGLFYCGNCHEPDGANYEWRLNMMLYDMDDNVAITPCCGVEALGALIGYERLADD